MDVTTAKTAEGATGLAQKTVTVCIQSRLALLEGTWLWDMQCNAIYCSDVVYFPATFEGTKGIIHPDDINELRSALSLLDEQQSFNLDFRIFTTYGEIKSVKGRQVFLRQRPEEQPAMANPQPWMQAAHDLLLQKEVAHLQQLKHLSDTAEKFSDTGTWFINKSSGEAYYSDNAFRLHGLPPQSLNIHPHMFQPFIHADDRAIVMEVLDKAYEAHLPVHIEYRIEKYGGNVRHLQLITEWSFNHLGEYIQAGIVRDISDQKAQEASQSVQDEILKVQRQTLRFTEQWSSTGWWHTNSITRKTAFSDNYFRIFGLKPSTDIKAHNSFLELVHPADASMVKESIERFYREHEMPEIKFRIVRRDGAIRQVRQTGKIFISSTSEVYLMGIVQDITTLNSVSRKSEEAKHDAEHFKALYQLAEEAAALGTITWQLPDEGMTWSDGVYTLLGYKPNAVEPRLRLFEACLEPGDHKVFQQTVRLALNGEPTPPLSLRLFVKGRAKQLSVTFRHLADESHKMVVAQVQDTTASALVQQELAEERRLQLLLSEAVDEVIVLTDPNHTIIKWNGRAELKTGRKKGEALHWNLFDLFPDLGTEEYLEQLKAALSGETVNGTKQKGGYFGKSHRYTLLPYKNEEGEVTGVFHFVHDLSKESDLEERLNERLSFIESLVESSVDRIVVLDRNMNYVYWNNRAEAYYGITKKEVIGRNILEIFPGFRDDPSYKEFRRAIHGEIVHIPATQNLKAKKGYFETYLIPVRNKSNEISGILWIVHDLLGEYMLQQQQRKADEILNMVNVVFIELDHNYRITFVNPIAERYLNNKRDDLLGNVFWEVYPQAVSTPGYQAVVKANTERVKADVEFFSNVYGRWIFMSVSPTDNGVVLVQYDWQELKEAKAKLQRSQRWIQQTAAVSPDAVFIYDILNRQQMHLNDHLAGWLGLTLDELAAGEDSLIHPGEQTAFLEYGSRVAAAGDDEILTLEYRMRAKDGRYVWVRNRSKVFERDSNGAATFTLSILQNITGEKIV